MSTLSWLLVALGLSCIAFNMFLYDFARFLRREPFNVLLWGEVDARHPFYMLAVLDFFAPYVLLFVALAAAAYFATQNILGSLA